MAEDHPRQGCFLDILQGRPLDLGEIAHLRLGEADVVEIAQGHLLEAGLDLGRGQAVVLTVPTVELD